MPRAITLYVRCVDAATRWVGRATMYLIFVMTGVLLFSSITRTVFNMPLIWSVEFSQFTMSAYYLLGGAYAMLMRGHVRMDLFYESWSSRKQGLIDAVTDLCLMFYLVVLLIGALSSIEYAMQYDQTARSAWAPPLAPIKIIMGIGILLMLLQSVSTFFKDVAKARGKNIV